MNDCPRLGKLFGGCKFEARYDFKAVDPERVECVEIMGDDQLHMLGSETYVCDVCVRCGETVTREPQGERSE